MTGSRPRESYSVSKGNAAIPGSPFALPETISFKAYAEVFTQYDFQLYTLNSFIISSVATLVSLMIYAMAVYVFAKFTFPGRNIIYVLFTVTLLVPPHAKAQPTFSLVLNLSLYDTRAALALVYLSMGLASQPAQEFMISPVKWDTRRIPSRPEKAELQPAHWEYHLAGIIVQGLRTHDPYYTEVTRSDMPCVLIDMPADETRFSCVMSDNKTASREAYHAALEDAGIPRDAALVVDGMYLEDTACSAAGKLLREYPEITGIFSASYADIRFRGG